MTEISSPHIHQTISIQQVMRQVMVALLPGLLLSIWILGWGVLFQCILAVCFALVCEALMLKLRGQPLRVYLYDGSVIVTAILFAVVITPYTPWWVNLCGIGFAVIFAKHIYGGLGYNLFNPAMAGYAFVLICFPVEMNHWPDLSDTATAGFIDTLQIILTGSTPALDGMTGATSLGYVKSQLNGMAMYSEIRTSPLFGIVGGKGWEIIALAWLLGGIWLLINKIIQWHMPVIFIVSIFVLSLFFYWIDNDIYATPLFHVFSGGTLLAAFFILTDPVTSPASTWGKCIFAILVALITVVIRNWGAYPEGIAFAVLGLNAAVPLINDLSRRKVFGAT